MSTHRWGTPEEFELLTGETGSVYFGVPAKRPAQRKNTKTQPSDSGSTERKENLKSSGQD